MGRNAPGAYRGGNRGRDSRPSTKAKFEQKQQEKPKTQLEDLARTAKAEGWTEKVLFQGNKTYTHSKWIKGDTEITVTTKTDTGKIRNVDVRRQRKGGGMDTLEMISVSERDKRKRSKAAFKNFGGK
ncbi:hypothetical protein J4T94_gp001 [Mycobacterium phage Krypton555]|uniref:Uncharacterized protein n=1 Tax=Mycobacterium phage Krypton555 TaxID=2015885 RepID=A0A222ZSD9_9CAUD|nr:hypothetical protein J4T94_gp001 [Mycobacterium phage Krypton555]ASR87041.1 hypothetical protein KRYPTON555_1 [Mycobacterium phage Krypton555]